MLELLLVRPRLRLDCERDHGLRELHRFEDHRMRLGADSVAGRDLLETRDGYNLTGIGLFNVLALVGVHLQDASNALAIVPCRVVEHRSPP